MENPETLLTAGILFMSFSIWGFIICKMLLVNHNDKNSKGE